jgi:hypothetical protein
MILNESVRLAVQDTINGQAGKEKNQPNEFISLKIRYSVGRFYE